MEWENLIKVLPKVDFPFHEDKPKIKEMTTLVSPITLPNFLDITNNHGHISFQVGRFPVPNRFLSHFLDLRIIFMKRKFHFRWDLRKIFSMFFLANLTWQRFWTKENYENNDKFKIRRVFPSKVYMCSLLSLVSMSFTFLLCLFLYLKNMISINTLPFFLSLKKQKQ